MLIELLIQREGGSDIEIPVQTYSFKPNKELKNIHTCEVTNAAHIKRFLSIKEAYRAVSGELPKEEEVVIPESSLEPDSNSEPVEPENDDGMNESEYLEKYIELFGEKPHHKAKPSTIKKKVDDILTPQV